MEVKVTIGITPTLEKILSNLFSALSPKNISVQMDLPQESVQPTTQQQVQQSIQQTQPAQQVPIQSSRAATATQPVQTVVPTIQTQRPVQSVQQPQNVPTSAPKYTLDQLQLAATQLMDAGRMADLQQLLASFGIQYLTALPEEQYGAFATKLRELGAKI